MGDRAAAEDVVLEAFLKVVDGIAGFDGARAFEPWFYRIVVNRAIDYCRKARRSEGRPELLAISSTPSADLDTREVRIVLARFRDSMNQLRQQFKNPTCSEPGPELFTFGSGDAAGLNK